LGLRFVFALQEFQKTNGWLRHNCFLIEGCSQACWPFPTCWNGSIQLFDIELPTSLETTFRRHQSHDCFGVGGVIHEQGISLQPTFEGVPSRNNVEHRNNSCAFE